MVPGMTERDRLIADSQRIEWLADARFGPAHRPTASNRLFCENVPQPAIPRDRLRRGLESALAMGTRLRGMLSREAGLHGGMVETAIR